MSTRSGAALVGSATATAVSKVVILTILAPSVSFLQAAYEFDGRNGLPQADPCEFPAVFWSSCVAGTLHPAYTWGSAPLWRFEMRVLTSTAIALSLVATACSRD